VAGHRINTTAQNIMSSGEEEKSSAAPAPEGCNETKWVDAWIRWPEDENKGISGQETDGGDNDSDDEPFDPFAQDPKQIFSFSFALPDSIVTDKNSTIDIELHGYSDDSDQAWSSTGLTLWRAAEHLCNYLVAHYELLQDKRILELGVGLGLVGILAHQLCSLSNSNSSNSSYSSNVVVTDGDTDALAKLRHNVQRHKLNRNISCRQLLWGTQTTEQFLDQYNVEMKRPQSSPPQFDVLLASDIVYVDTILPPLFETIQTLLNKPNGIFVFAYCSRRQVPVTIGMVLKHATNAGFSYQLEEEVDGIFVYSFRWHVDNGGSS